ncbi:hypothetical protein EVAR_71500_1 [Eumeta japonica]|uniref:Uncharacterized protein n=1 Tax=Eumeta variegata TaxID=151549 RepID=A0A4C2AFB4_EUMVA|nr:hypothetical protein EVAR_71500_1 [Eumeta japonica]
MEEEIRGSAVGCMLHVNACCGQVFIMNFHELTPHTLELFVNIAGQQAVPQNKESGSGSSGITECVENPEQRLAAGLSLAAQLIALLAWYLDVRLPYPLNFSEYGSARIGSGGSGSIAEKCARRLGACVVALALRSGQVPPSYPPAALAALHELARAAAIDEPQLGRVEAWLSSSLCGAGATWEETWPPADSDDDEPPEHLHWADVDQVNAYIP